MNIFYNVCLISTKAKRENILFGYPLSAKYCLKGWEFNGEQNNARVFINKCCGESPIITVKLDKNEVQ